MNSISIYVKDIVLMKYLETKTAWLFLIIHFSFNRQSIRRFFSSFPLLKILLYFFFFFSSSTFSVRSSYRIEDFLIKVPTLGFSTKRFIFYYRFSCSFIFTNQIRVSIREIIYFYISCVVFNLYFQCFIC